MKKALEVSSNVVVLLTFIVIIAVVILLILFFGKNISSNPNFNYWSNFAEVFK